MLIFFVLFAASRQCSAAKLGMSAVHLVLLMRSVCAWRILTLFPLVLQLLLLASGPVLLRSPTLPDGPTTQWRHSVSEPFPTLDCGRKAISGRAAISAGAGTFMAGRTVRGSRGASDLQSWSAGESECRSEDQCNGQLQGSQWRVLNDPAWSAVIFSGNTNCCVLVQTAHLICPI